ncbi:hypothetical protein ONE63_011447 [Megalurothrips usitatus]|uniref:Uncharacterized protein n=1 Tax=Megalurothrips usitatus TaxID=439358 RepID=A0AAV7X1U4_9NEOP|nr:hypothetical protein ONE63_011447 [Megalurothrips usitatus]
MVLDNLHWASFGVARRMGTLWLGETKKKKNNNNEQQIPMPPFYVGTDETKSVISARISKLRPPLEVRRLPRQVSQVHDYNAREWENITLYFSIPVFKNILPERYLKHWMLFVQAFYLLMKSDLTKHEAEVAGILMEKYVNGVEELYGRKELTFNMHLCTHAMDNALRWSNGSSISTFAFENGNKHLKAKIHAERGISHQLLRSLDRDSALNILRNLASTPQSSDFRSRMDRKEVKKSFFAGAVRCMKPKSFSPSREELWHCEQLNVDAAQFLECSRIIYGNVCYSVDNVEQGIIAISTAQLKTICVNMNINRRFLKEHFICVMANTSNVF